MDMPTVRVPMWADRPQISEEWVETLDGDLISDQGETQETALPFLEPPAAQEFPPAAWEFPKRPADREFRERPARERRDTVPMTLVFGPFEDDAQVVCTSDLEPLQMTPFLSNDDLARFIEDIVPYEPDRAGWEAAPTRQVDDDEAEEDDEADYPSSAAVLADTVVGGGHGDTRGHGDSREWDATREGTRSETEQPTGSSSKAVLLPGHTQNVIGPPSMLDAGERRSGRLWPWLGLCITLLMLLTGGVGAYFQQ
jgi:hypothetical protein